MADIHTTDIEAGEDDEGPAALLLDLQHQIHLRQAEIDQRDFALLFVHEHLESLKSLVLQRDHEISWLKKQQEVANRLITHLRNQIATIKSVAQPALPECRGPAATSSCHSTTFTKSASDRKSTVGHTCSPYGASRAVADCALRRRSNVHLERCKAPSVSHQDPPGSMRQQASASQCLRKRAPEASKRSAYRRTNSVDRTPPTTSAIEPTVHCRRRFGNKAQHRDTACLQSGLKEREEEERKLNGIFMAYEDREQASAREAARLSDELEALKKQREFMRTELRRHDCHVLELEKTLERQRLELERNNEKTAMMQRAHALQLACQSADHEKEIARLERRIVKSTRLRQQEASHSAALMTAAEARERAWCERSLMAACEVSERRAQGEELKQKLDDLVIYQLMFTELSKGIRNIEHQLCCAVCLQVPVSPITFLPCAHTVCEGCLSDHSQLEKAKNLPGYATPRSCPGCRELNLSPACASVIFAFENGAVSQVLRQIGSSRSEVQKLRESLKTAGLPDASL